MIDHTLMLRLAAALAIGLLVGIERGWQDRDAPAGSRTAGIRTYGLCGFLGALLAVLSGTAGGPLLLGFGFSAFALVFAWFKSREARHDQDYSVTGVVAALVVFALGALCVAGDPIVAAAGGVATAGLLASREVLHRLLTRLTWGELRSALLLLAMTVIVLPLLPDQAIDPLGSINLREIWLFTVLTAVISFAGYVAVRLAGPTRGILLSALAGAVASSTAVTIAFARRAKGGEPIRLLAGGAALAGCVSILRVLVITGLIAPAVLATLAPGASAAALLFAAGGIVLMRQRGAMAAATPALGNPFELRPLLAFALAFATVAAISGWLTREIGDGGIFVTSGLVGLVDVDVAVLSAARLSGQALTPQTAAQAMLLALAVNALARVAYASLAGPPAYALRLGLVTAAALVAGGLGVTLPLLLG